MSDHSRSTRKIPARILPVTKITPKPALAPRVDPIPEKPYRVRTYGAPLAAATRLLQPLQKPAPKAAGATPSAKPPAVRPPLVKPVLAKTPPAKPVATKPPQRPVAPPAGQPVPHPEEPWRTPDAPPSAPQPEARQTPLDGPQPDQLILWEQPPQPRDDSGNRFPAWVTAAAPALRDDDYAELGAYVATALAGFCDFCKSPAVTENGPWHARLDMPQVVLPDTALELDVSKQHVKLRFETGHPVSREVLNRYLDRLQEEVKRAIADARSVEITLW